MSVDNFLPDLCVICCEQTVESLVTVRTSTYHILIRAAAVRGCGTLAAYIESDPPVIVVQNSCRTKFTDPGQFDNRATDVVDTCGKKLWSSGNTFTWKDQCFFCASNAVRGVGPVHSSDIRITTEFADAL